MSIRSDSEVKPVGFDTGPARRSGAPFWIVAATIVLVLAGNSTPTPLYVDYQRQWGFSPLTLTAIFAIYSVGVILTLVLAGGLSDRMGRRPVLLGSLVLLIASYVTFLGADGTGWLFLARAVQGLATGLFTGAAGATLVDLHRQSDRRVASLINSICMPLGLALGAPVSGALAQWAPLPLRVPFLVLTVLTLVALAGIAARVPESAGQPGGRRLVRVQRVSVPAEARAPFVTAALGVSACWAVGGLFLGLGGSLAKQLLHNGSHLMPGLVVLSMQGVSAGTQLVWNLRVRSLSNDTASRLGCAGLIAAMPAVVLSVATRNAVLFFAGAVIAGLGFGLAFMASTRRITEAAPAARRGETLAGYFIVAYLGFSAPVVAAGFLTTVVGLLTTVYLYAALVVVVATAALIRVQRSMKDEHDW
jgi:MFS family permease